MALNAGVQAADTLLKVLSAFIDDQSDFMLKTLSARSGMPPAKVHRYLISLCRMGYVVQIPLSNRYRLGPSALRLALSTVRTINPVVVVQPLMEEIRRILQHSIALSIWQSGGPTVVLSEVQPGPLAVVMREGTKLPLLRSATGNIFASLLPEEYTSGLLAAELDRLIPLQLAGDPASLVDVKQLLMDVKLRGLARVTGQLTPGAHALAAPVFDSTGNITAVISTFGPAGAIDTSWSGPTSKALQLVARDLSRCLGYSDIVSKVVPESTSNA